ncbi:MAG: T9SS type A sorting domain-containing protein [Hymenobacter sp.]|nr:MAG: T9SS type A sorting domain-containing protein [Hymenobacter sp.]
MPLISVTGTNQLVASNAGNSVTLVTPRLATTTTRVNNETNTGYVLGTLRTTLEALPGTPQDFGGMGLTLNFDPAFGMPGNVSVSRATGQPFTGANPTSGAYSIKRAFTVVPVNASPMTGFRASLVFNYLDVDYMNVGPTNTTLDDAYFYLAYSTNSTSFGSLGYTTRDNNTTVNNNTLTKDVVPLFGSATFTLADERNPLPVSLVAFNAKRAGDVALITWETAMERNNKGFEIQVSTDGATFHSLGFVASNSPDSNKRLAYSYTDNEANKSGIRYYRLHQIDLSGDDDYSPVRAVSFAAAGESIAALSAYPNPFSSDEIKLALQSSEAGQASLRLTDLMGRQVSAQSFTAVKGVTEVSIDQAAQLAAGSYLAQITAPSGEVKTVRIQKR